MCQVAIKGGSHSSPTGKSATAATTDEVSTQGYPERRPAHDKDSFSLSDVLGILPEAWRHYRPPSRTPAFWALVVMDFVPYAL